MFISEHDFQYHGGPRATQRRVRLLGALGHHHALAIASRASWDWLSDSGSFAAFYSKAILMILGLRVRDEFAWMWFAFSSGVL